MKIKALLLPVVASAAVFLAGCGSSDKKLPPDVDEAATRAIMALYTEDFEMASARVGSFTNVKKVRDKVWTAKVHVIAIDEDGDAHTEDRIFRITDQGDEVYVETID